MKKKHMAALALSRLGGERLLDQWWGSDRITVLAYHRITEFAGSDFQYYQPVVSATPAMFERQMAYIASRFNVIDLQQLVDFVRDGAALPPRPLLITFDDGYLDNYANAYPVLRQYGFSAVIFLMTSRMNDPMPPWWDECAIYFHKTIVSSADLPLIGMRSLVTAGLRVEAREALMSALKRVPENDKLKAISELRRVLEVEQAPRDPDLFMTWDHVRELVAAGITCQPHTVTHPILTRVEPDEQRRQLEESIAHIRSETGQQISAFAYPNGTTSDYDVNTLHILRALDIPLAFTLTDGPATVQEVQQHPLEIRRVYLGRNDTLEMFKMKVMGLPRLFDRGPVFVEGER